MRHEPLITSAEQATLRNIIDFALDHGWQPADVVHAVRTRTNQRGADAAATLVGDHGRRHDAQHRAPLAWVTQLDALAEPGRRSLATLTHKDVTALYQIGTWLPLRALLPPPSKWAASNVGGPDTCLAAKREGPVDTKLLATIRALLAKAESTSFEYEAEAFTAKAQQLMTRNSINAAMLAVAADSGPGVEYGVDARRVHIESPYATAKSRFLSAIADVNKVETVWSQSPGFTTLIGFPVDLQLTEVLFTSLLVQATRAAAAETAVPSDRVKSFRSAFLLAYGTRVAERLEEARRVETVAAERIYGSALAPVLATRDQAVERRLIELFPTTFMSRSRSVDAAGWYAGRAAAERADLGAGPELESA